MHLRVSRKNVLVYAGLPALILLLLTFSTQPVAARGHRRNYPVSMTTDISYGPFAAETLDQCVPRGISSLRPGIIMIHGGGWTGGDKAQYDDLCSSYAAEGFVVTTINYRLTPDHQWPDQIGDAQLAVRYMRVNAPSTRLDPSRICALGDSAGAHLSLLLDELQTIHQSDVANIYPNTSPTVQCVVDQFGPSALAQLYNENPSVQQLISNLLDNLVPPGTIYQNASPLDQLVPQAGPALIIQGTLDQTVLPDQSLELQQAFQNDNIPVQYISYDGGHEYKDLSQKQYDAILVQINTFLISMEQP